MRRPSRTAATMVAKLSSSSTRLDASRATSVPPLPMATPMSAAFSAGASFTPSPVMATNCPCGCSACTMRIFCAGSTRAYTRTPSTRAFSVASSSSLSSAPVMACAASSGTMPRRRAIASAVAGWSPVIITGRMPALMQSRTAVAASSRGGSIMPIRPISARSLSMASTSGSAGSRGQARQAKAITRRPCAARRSGSTSTASWSSGSKPLGDQCAVQRGSTLSGAPLVKASNASPSAWKVVMRLRSASKGSSRTRGVSSSSAGFSKSACAATAASAVSVGSPCQAPGPHSSVSAQGVASLQGAFARRPI